MALNEAQKRLMAEFGVPMKITERLSIGGQTFVSPSVKSTNPELGSVKRIQPVVESGKLNARRLLNALSMLGQKISRPWSEAGGAVWDEGVLEIDTTRVTGCESEDAALPLSKVQVQTLKLNFMYDTKTSGVMTVNTSSSLGILPQVITEYTFKSIADNMTMNGRKIGEALHFTRADSDHIKADISELLKKLVMRATGHNNHMLRLVKMMAHYYCLLVNEFCGRPGTAVKKSDTGRRVTRRVYSLATLLEVNARACSPIACKWSGSLEYVEFLESVTGQYPLTDWVGAENIYHSFTLPAESNPMVIMQNTTVGRDETAPMTQDPERWLSMVCQYAYERGLQAQLEAAMTIAVMLPYAKPNNYMQHTIPVPMPTTLVDAFIYGIEPVNVVIDAYAPGVRSPELVLGAKIGNILADGFVRQVVESCDMRKLKTYGDVQAAIMNFCKPIKTEASTYARMRNLCGDWVYAFAHISHFNSCSDRELWEAARGSLDVRALTDCYENYIEGSSLSACGEIRVPHGYEQRVSRASDNARFMALASFISADEPGEVTPPAWNHGMEGYQSEPKSLNGMNGKVVFSRVVERRVRTVIRVDRNSYNPLSVKDNTDKTFRIRLPNEARVKSDMVSILDDVVEDVSIVQTRLHDDQEARRIYREARVRAKVLPLINAPPTPIEPIRVAATTEEEVDTMVDRMLRDVDELNSRDNPSLVKLMRASANHPLPYALLGIMGSVRNQGTVKISQGTRRGTLFLEYERRKSFNIEAVDLKGAVRVVNELAQGMTEAERGVAAVFSDSIEALCSLPVNQIVAGLRAYRYKGRDQVFRARINGETSATDQPLYVTLDNNKTADLPVRRVQSMFQTAGTMRNLRLNMFEQHEPVGLGAGSGDCGPLSFIQGAKVAGKWNRGPSVRTLRTVVGTDERFGNTSQTGVWWSVDTLTRAANIYKVGLVVFDNKGNTLSRVFSGENRPFVAIYYTGNHFMVLKPKRTTVGRGQVREQRVPEPATAETVAWREALGYRKAFFQDMPLNPKGDKITSVRVVQVAMRSKAPTFSPIYKQATADYILKNAEPLQLNADDIAAIIPKYVALCMGEIDALKHLLSTCGDKYPEDVVREYESPEDIDYWTSWGDLSDRS